MTSFVTANPSPREPLAPVPYYQHNSPARNKATPKSGPSIQFELILLNQNNILYAIRSGQILRLIGAPSQNRLEPPTTEDHSALLGTMSGSELPIFDLGKMLEPDLSLTSKPQILIIENQNRVIGLQVDSISEVRRVTLEDLTVLPPLVERNLTRPVAWALWESQSHGMVVLLDPVQLLTENEWQKYGKML